ncbi:Variant SH3 domain containing protein, partial [Aphelenchoides avenae]
TAPSSSPEAASNGSAPLRVIAKYKFIGRCNDELTFEKNDIITVTQQLDGGWWEGALNGQVGWFPADYIGIIKTSTDTKHGAQRNGVAKDVNENLEASRLAFRKEVITAYLTQEKQHIAHLLRICRDFLDHIKFDKILIPAELSTLSSNISDIVHFKEHLMSVVEEAISKDLATQRIGAIFLNAAPEFKALLKTYCENHPLAVDLINRKRDLLQKSLATRKLDLKDLISGLSLVFRHVSKYAISLQEIERNTPEAHADRGNLQRAAAVYRDISNYCTFLRKQKEIQLEFLSTAHLEEWLGKDFEKVVGPLIYVGPVTVSASEPTGKEDDVVTDRCFALFARSILLLELSPERNNYVLRNRIATTDLVVQKNDSKMSFTLRK